MKAMCERNQPDVLVRSALPSEMFLHSENWLHMEILMSLKFCASMWTAEESEEIQRIARETVSGIKTMAIPHGLQVEKGPDAVVALLKEKWPGLVES